MGEVYLAEDNELHRSVALKVLPSDVSSNRDRMRRFKQEATAAAALNHPNIAHIYQIGESDGTRFIAMEFVDGFTLRQLIHERQMDLLKLLRYLQHVAEGLAKAHAGGIMHRDLKPDNIMVTREGHAKILDFGLAKLIEPQTSQTTAQLVLDPGPRWVQIWQISFSGDETRKVTNDLNNYSRLSLTADSSAIVTVQTEGASSIWVAPQGDAGRAKQISSGRYDGQQGLSWMPGGKIAYTSRESGLTDIWSMGQDGKDQKQLTAHAATNLDPWATPDGRYITFSSTRKTASRSLRSIWRMDTDGGNLKQLTGGQGDRFPKSSPDGRWVVFHSERSGSLRAWKVSIDGGEPVPLTDKLTSNPIVSPDGSLVACWYRDDQPNMLTKVAIIPFAGGDPVRVLDMPSSVNIAAGLRWTPDGRALNYIDTVNGVSNVWSLPLDGGPPKQLTDFKADQIFWFDFSRDGKPLAVSRGIQTTDVILIRDFR